MPAARCPFSPLRLELRLEGPDGGLKDRLLVRQLLHPKQRLGQLVSHLEHLRLYVGFDARVSGRQTHPKQMVEPIMGGKRGAANRGAWVWGRK